MGKGKSRRKGKRGRKHSGSNTSQSPLPPAVPTDQSLPGFAGSKVSTEGLQSLETENSEVYRLLEGQAAYATEKDGYKIYHIGCHEERNDAEKGFRVFNIGRINSAHPSTSTRCVMLLGETGAGKTTFISAMLNYLFGVQYDDPFRLQVEEEIQDGRPETASRTDIITVYTVYYQEGMKHKYNFVLIDTPGLADTRGPQHHEVCMQQLETLLTSDFGVDDLHCLGIIAKGNTNRIIDHQKNLLGEINSLLGKHVPDITHVFATHALEAVSVDAVVRDSGIPFRSMFEFDNGSLLCPKENDEVLDPRKRWKRMTEQYDMLFDALIKAQSTSIKIIREKKMYDICTNNIKEQIKLLAESMATNYNTKKKVEKYESLEKANEKWKETEEVVVTDVVELELGTHAHNCNICEQTCRTCSSKLCSVSPGGMAVDEIASGAGVLAASAIQRFARTPMASLVAGAAAGLATYGAMKSVPKIKGKMKCNNSGCGHTNSEHVIKQIKKTKRIKKNEIIDENMKEKHQAAVSKKKDTNIKLIEGKQKVLSRITTLSKDTVKLLHHAKTVQDLSEEGFDYMNEIKCHLDGGQLKDHINNTIEEVAEKNIVHVLQKAMEQLDSCAMEDVFDKSGVVKKMLSDIKLGTEAVKSRVAYE